MQIGKVQNSSVSPSMKAGLYFTNKSTVLYNQDRNINFVTKEAVKVSKDGFRYIEDNLIPQSVKDRFASMPFIKKYPNNLILLYFLRKFL